jgi:hypothetical protein
MRTKEEMQKAWIEIDLDVCHDDYDLGRSEALGNIVNEFNYDRTLTEHEVKTLECLPSHKSELFILGYIHALEWALGKRKEPFVFR